ncbi:MAG: pyridoxal phosphate-dependent aminotransferase, partial [Patescibacteria group bacterium]|nr:pyridoxal phosphate-dependent aminotransferase [Patescibacteria group bacterium]
IKFKNSFYTEDDICITEGSTGAITLVIEYIKNTYLNAEVLIAGPTYYLYKFASTYYNLPIREVITVDKKNPFAFNLKLLKNSISEKTKLIVLVRPNNPVGEIYTAADVSEILLIAKEKNILVLADEIFFELIFNKNAVEECDILAEKTQTLNNLVIVKGYSKNKNLAAFRIGYVLSKNKDLLTAAQEISEQRQCFPNAQNYTGIICLDSFIQATNTLIKKKGLLIEQAISQARKNLSFSPTIKEKTYNELKTIYVNYQKYIQEKMKYYSENLETALTMLQDDLAYMLPKTTAFNTLVKIKGLEGINHFDFCFNLLLTTGTESQIGPCFAFDQQVWQENPNLGFWLRLSYSRETFLEGVKNFVEFKKIYLENKDKFLKTNILLKQGNMIK